MKPALRSELRKLFTVRSTYLVGLFTFILICFLSFYAQGYKNTQLNSLWLTNTLSSVSNTASFFLAIIALLLMAHEYRYNTINYTLTAANNRSKVLAAKIIAIFSWTFLFVLIADLLGLGLMLLGAKAAGHHLPHQEINILTYLGKSIFYTEGFVLVALLINTMVRNLAASVAILFIVPNTVEGLLRIAIKQPEKWLPFSALNQVVQPQLVVQGGAGGGYLVSPLRGAIIFLIYLLAGWFIAWYLFLRRDAQ